MPSQIIIKNADSPRDPAAVKESVKEITQLWNNKGSLLEVTFNGDSKPVVIPKENVLFWSAI